MSNENTKYTLIINIFGEEECVNEYYNILNLKKENDYYFLEYKTTKGLFKFIIDNKVDNPYSIIYLHNYVDDIDLEKMKELTISKTFKRFIMCPNLDNLMYDVNLKIYSKEFGNDNSVNIITSLNTGLNKDLPFYYISHFYLDKDLKENIDNFEFIDVKIINENSTLKNIYETCMKYSENFEIFKKYCDMVLDVKSFFNDDEYKILIRTHYSKRMIDFLKKEIENNNKLILHSDDAEYTEELEDDNYKCEEIIKSLEIGENLTFFLTISNQ